MSGSKTVLLAGLFGFLMAGFASQGSAAEFYRGSCRRGERIMIQDLDMTPDPIIEGQRVRSWKVRIRLDGDRECSTELEVRERDNPVGGARFTLRPGVNEIEIPVAERFRFSGREHCFNVVANLEGTRRPIDAERRFCAQQRPSWTLREPFDRDRPPPPRR